MLDCILSALVGAALRRCALCFTDPMNALQSLTSGPAAGATGIGIPSRGPGQPLGGMSGLGAMGQPMPLSGQPPPGTSGMAPHSMAVVSTAAPQSEYHMSQNLPRYADTLWSVLRAGWGRAGRSSASQKSWGTGALSPGVGEGL